MDIEGKHLVEPRSYMERGYPWAEWKQLRREAPVAWFEPEGWMPFWAITKHADIIEVSKQPDVFLNAPGHDRDSRGAVARPARGRLHADAHDHQHGSARPPQVPKGREPVVHAARA